MDNMIVDKMDTVEFIKMARKVKTFMVKNGIENIEFIRLDLDDAYDIGLSVDDEVKKCLVTIQI